MSQIFRRRANTLARTGVAVLILLVGGLSLIAAGLMRSPYVTTVGNRLTTVGNRFRTVISFTLGNSDWTAVTATRPSRTVHLQDCLQPRPA
jgi:hypothetical protein